MCLHGDGKHLSLQNSDAPPSPSRPVEWKCWMHWLFRRSHSLTTKRLEVIARCVSSGSRRTALTVFRWKLSEATSSSRCRSQILAKRSENVGRLFVAYWASALPTGYDYWTHNRLVPSASLRSPFPSASFVHSPGDSQPIGMRHVLSNRFLSRSVHIRVNRHKPLARPCSRSPTRLTSMRNAVALKELTPSCYRSHADLSRRPDLHEECRGAVPLEPVMMWVSLA